MPELRTRSSKLKVAIVIPTHWDYLMGGSQYQAKLLIEELYQNHGANIVYFTSRAGANRDFADHQVVSVGRVNTLRRFGLFWDYFRLQRALRKFSPDVIYQRVGCAYTGISADYANRSGVPMIWHVASEKDCGRAPAVRQLLGRPHELIETRLAKLGATRADLVVAQTQDQINMLRESFGREADRLIRNFHQVPPAFDKRTGRFTVLWIANLKPLKRPALFLEIASRLQEMSEIDFVMVGQAYPSDSMRDAFDRKVQMHSNVKFLGAVTQDEVNALLDRSHLLVNTSEWEGFSNTFIQAWMRSVPVLTLGVNPDSLLGDSFLGCSYESTVEIANSIRELASNSDMLKDMGEKSRQYAIEHFSMKNATELADLIIQAASDNLGKPADKQRI